MFSDIGLNLNKNNDYEIEIYDNGKIIKNIIIREIEFYKIIKEDYNNLRVKIAKSIIDLYEELDMDISLNYLFFIKIYEGWEGHSFEFEFYTEFLKYNYPHYYEQMEKYKVLI
jgi:hypothetical protein